MRFIDFATGLVFAFLASAACAFEIEDRRLYPADGGDTITVLSTADLDVFEPFILQFRADNPTIGVDYIVASSTEVHRAVQNGESFDIVMSSAMDLQFQLANDGLAQSYSSAATDTLPEWAQWRSLIFAFTAEPAVAVISTRQFAGLEVPRTRQQLISILRDNPDRFAGKVGTYDVRESGLGYLFATQEARSSDVFWRMSEVIGRTEPKLYCCSSQMIDDIIDGDLAIAYNVLGSYAARRLTEVGGSEMQVLELEDFSNVMLRSALIPQSAANVDGAGAFLDALIRTGLNDASSWAFPPVQPATEVASTDFGPIRLGPALMVYLDPLTRRAFLASWEDAMEQR